MKRSIHPIRILFALGASLALALPALAQMASDTGDASSTVTIVSARNLSGHTLRDAAGERLGEIRYVMVRLGGEVAAVAVRPEQGAEPDLLVVPWRALDFGFVENEIRVSTQQSRLREAPRFSSDELAQLTKPAAWTAVTEYWAPFEIATGDTGAERSGSQTGAAQQAAQTGSQAGPQGAQQAAGPGTATGAAGQRGTTQQAAASGAAGDPADGLILVGRNLVTTMTTPAFRFTEQLRGTDVVTRDGRDVGEIDEVAIDPRSGQVAFVSIHKGGTLGFGGDWYAVPIETLRWTAQEDRIQLDADLQKLEELDALDASRTPMRVQRSQLASLYQRFDVTPYWEASRQQARSGPSPSGMGQGQPGPDAQGQARPPQDQPQGQQGAGGSPMR